MATPIQRDPSGAPRPRVVSRQPSPPGQPPAGGGGVTPPAPSPAPPQSGQLGGMQGSLPPSSGSGGSVGGTLGQIAQRASGGANAVGAQRSGNNITGATPFMQTPGMQIASAQGYDPGQRFASMRVSGQDIQGDPAVSAALSNFSNQIQPGIQNAATRMGLGRSTAALNSITNAQGAMLSPLYESAMGRENERIGRMTQQGNFEAGLSNQRLDRMGTAAENELGRGERSAQRVADANQNQANLLMNYAQMMYGRGQQTGQNLMGAGGQFRDISQQANSAEQQDFLRRQALGESAVLTPFGGLAQGGLGSTTTSSGK